MSSTSPRSKNLKNRAEQKQQAGIIAVDIFPDGRIVLSHCRNKRTYRLPAGIGERRCIIDPVAAGAFMISPRCAGWRSHEMVMVRQIYDASEI
jgi:hypothetical protein